MAGGGSFSSDQKFTTLTADGRFKTITGGATNLGPCRATYIMAQGVNNSVVKLHDGTSNAGTLEFQAKFSTEGLDVFVPCLLYTSPSPRDRTRSRMPSSA